MRNDVVNTPRSRKLGNRHLGLAALLAALLALGLLAGCGDESSPTETPTMADINEFIASLNAWPEPDADNEGPTGEDSEDSSDSVGGDDYECTSVPYSITQTPDKIVVFDPDDEIFWLGALLQGDGYRDGIGSLSELPIRQRGAMEVTIDLLGPEMTQTVNDPSPSTISAAIGELITQAENSGETYGSDIFFDQTLSHSVEQSAIKMGLSASYLGATVNASLDFSEDASQTTMSAYFLQKMFTTSMTLPQLPEDLFSNEFTEERLQEQVDLGRIGPDNQPTFLSSITWGRLMILTITSSSSQTEISAALSASYGTVSGEGSGEIEGHHLSLLEEASIQLVALGGDQAAALGYLRTGELGQFFAEDAPLTSAVPLSFTVRNVQTNEKALVSETTSYNVKTCSVVEPEPIGAKWRVTLDQLHFVDANCDGGGYIEAYWNIQTTGGAYSIRSESSPHDAYTGTVFQIGSSSAVVDILNSGAGSISVSGTLHDDDFNGDDLIANWALTYNTYNIEESQFTVSGGSPAGESCRVNLKFTFTKISDIYAD